MPTRPTRRLCQRGRGRLSAHCRRRRRLFSSLSRRLHPSLVSCRYRATMHSNHGSEACVRVEESQMRCIRGGTSAFEVESGCNEEKENKKTGKVARLMIVRGRTVSFNEYSVKKGVGTSIQLAFVDIVDEKSEKKVKVVVSPVIAARARSKTSSQCTLRPLVAVRVKSIHSARTQSQVPRDRPPFSRLASNNSPRLQPDNSEKRPRTQRHSEHHLHPSSTAPTRKSSSSNRAPHGDPRTSSRTLSSDEHFLLLSYCRSQALSRPREVPVERTAGSSDRSRRTAAGEERLEESGGGEEELEQGRGLGQEGDEQHEGE